MDIGSIPFEEWIWKTYDGRKEVNVEDFISDRSDCHFFVGTDSQNYSKRIETAFTSVLIAYQFGKGGTVITNRARVRMVDALRQRLLQEAMRSLEVAWFLDQRIPDQSFIGIHLDVNASLKFKSGQYKDELVGLIMAQGFNCLVKPDAWAATSVADSKC